MSWKVRRSNGDGGSMGGSNAAGKPVVSEQPRNILNRPTAPTTWA